MMRFRKLRFLGAGSYGRVHLAGIENSSSTSSFSAVKSANFYSSVQSFSLMKEKDFLDEHVGCPYIIQCFGDDMSIEKGETIYNVMMEYAPGGTLKGLMKERGGVIQESEAACYTAMLLQGLCIAHSKGIVHCDMKPDNVLVFPMEQSDGVLNHVLKIADFGLARRVQEKEINQPGRKSLNRGALLYASPEAVLCGVHLPANDIWSLGCIVVQILTGHPVWGNCSSQELIHKLAFEKPEIPECVSEIGRDFLTRCFERDPQKRWTTRMLLKHPFIANNLRHFRGIEHMICQRNPFSSTAQFGNRRSGTFSDFEEGVVYDYPRQTCLFHPTISQQSNNIIERGRLFAV